VPAYRLQRLANRRIRSIHPRAAATVAGNDSPSLTPQARRVVDEFLECRGLRRRIVPGEHNLRRVACVTWDVDRLIRARAISVQITQACSARIGERKWRAGLADVVERDVGFPPAPRRGIACREHH